MQKSEVEATHYLPLVALLLLLEDVELDAQVGIFALSLDVSHDLKQLQPCKDGTVRSKNRKRLTRSKHHYDFTFY